MESVIISPAAFKFLGFIPGWFFSLLIPIAGIALFTYIMAMRIEPLVRAKPDPRFDRIPERFKKVIKIWLGQWRHPRYMLAGVLHILIFAGFLILSIRSISMVVAGISDGFVLPGFNGFIGSFYNFFKDIAATIVFGACIIAGIRRGIFKPKRYAVPSKYGKDHTLEAVFVLLIICTLMLSESIFDASAAVAQAQTGHSTHFIAPLTLAWFFKLAFTGASQGCLQFLHIFSYYVHDITFFGFLCFLPLGKHFHVITSLFNVFFMRLDKGTVKPVMHGVSDDKLDDLESFGAKKFQDFTWKHLLDFYTCADCGRCSDNCPANAVARPLSPRFISIKGRNYIFENYPLCPEKAKQPINKNAELIGNIYDEDEIWSCTTCGACEEECPLGIEYINKIVDMRRGMVDEGMVPQSLQKPLSAIGKRGNPWGKMEKKRADWAVKDKEFAEKCKVKILEKGNVAETLYFVDSISSYDDRMQKIAQATASVLDAAQVDFGILGKAEKDSGNEVRRFGEEMLFIDLKEKNIDAITNADVKDIVTADPHAYNALKNDYTGIPQIKHISEVFLEKIQSGILHLKETQDTDLIYTYHDPCYLGRHNELYDQPRAVIDSIPGLTRVEMQKSRDRSFCCGGGGLMLFYEPEEEQRMGVLRVQMAHEARADVIITACPFCLVNIEDAIKVAGLEGQMQAIDLSELVAKHL